MKNKIILHIDMDAFFAQIEERENPHFKGRPIVVGAEPKQGRGVVSTCNYMARKYGIRSAMPISIAWKKCPDAVFLPVNMELYKRVSEKIMGIINNYSDKIEQVSVDEAYIDISYLKTFEKAEETAKKLKEDILKQEALASTVGIGPNKLIAKMATNKAKPDGLKAVKPNEVDEFIDPLDIEKIPGIGPKTAKILKGKGADTIKELKKIKLEDLIDIFGKNGEKIYEKARGIYSSEIRSEHIVKSIGKEHTFNTDTREPEAILKAFDDIVKEVYDEIREQGFCFRTITAVARFSGFLTHTKSKTLKEERCDIDILRKESKKLLLRLITENLKPIRLIGLRVKINN